MSKVTLQAEDVFFLSKMMKAKYLDYEYISMMDELSQRRAIKEATALENLSNAGLIFEDFTGDIEIEDLAKELFDPIFFGTFESELLIEDSLDFQRYKYHVLDDRYVEVQIDGKNLIIQTIEKEDILNHFPYMEELDKPNIVPLDYFKEKQVDGIMVLKRIKIGKAPQLIQLVNDNGVYYQAKGNKIHSMTKIELKSLMKEIIWEE